MLVLLLCTLFCSAAVGAWSGQLWGLVQDLTEGDGAVDGLALAYADEQKITDANGNVNTLILQMQVREPTVLAGPQGMGTYLLAGYALQPL